MELSLNFILFIVLSFLVVYVLTNYLEQICQKEEFKNNNQSESNNKNLKKECDDLIYLNPVQGKKLFNMDDKKWGWIGVGTNGMSVLFQLYSLFTSKSAQSFDITFIILMTILNGTYAILGLLIKNWGLLVATLIFVLYNLTVIFYYYSGLKKKKRNL